MGSTIQCILLIFLAVSIGSIFVGTAFAQSLITVQTDDSHYDNEDTIVISGQVSTVISTQPVTIQLYTGGSLIEVAQITVAQDGSYSHTIIAEGPKWNRNGDYTVKATYGEGNTVETTFSYTLMADNVETKPFEVDAGSRGTFDVTYTIRGGAVNDIVVDSHMLSLIVQIESTDDGTITLDLPREFVGAEKQNGTDETFIILIDGIEVTYEESATRSDSRGITIGFEQGDSEIQIIGTYIVPEFGVIIMAVLTVGILTAVLASRSRLQIKI